MKVQAVLQQQSGPLLHLVACTNPVGSVLDQIVRPLSVLVAWSESTDIEPQRHINKIEAIVSANCLRTWSNLIRGSLWLHFIDNDGALACLISGYSKNSSLSAFVDHTWAQIPALGLLAMVREVALGMQYVEGWSRRLSPLHKCTIGYVIRRSCL